MIKYKYIPFGEYCRGNPIHFSNADVMWLCNSQTSGGKRPMAKTPSSMGSGASMKARGPIGGLRFGWMFDVDERSWAVWVFRRLAHRVQVGCDWLRLHFDITTTLVARFIHRIIHGRSSLRNRWLLLHEPRSRWRYSILLCLLHHRHSHSHVHTHPHSHSTHLTELSLLRRHHSILTLLTESRRRRWRHIPELLWLLLLEAHWRETLR